MLRSQALSARDMPPARPDADTYTYIDNGVIRVGVDLTRGGAIGFLAASANPTLCSVEPLQPADHSVPRRSL